MRRNGESVYVKGATQSVIRADAAGYPLESIERDVDGELWHVVEGKQPTLIKEADARTLHAEAANTGGGGGQ